MLGSATRRSLARAGHEDIQSNSHICATRASRLGSTYSKPASPVSTPSASAVQGAAHGSSRRGSARCRTHKQRTSLTTVDFSGTAASICSSWSSREVHAASGSAYQWRNTTSSGSNSRAPGHGRPAASSLHLKSAAEDMQDAGLLDRSSLYCQATPMAVLAGSNDRSTSIYTHDSSSPRLSSSSHKLGSNHSSSRWTFEELNDSSSTSETSCLTNAPKCPEPDPRILLAQQLQHINLPADQFSAELSSVLQQAVVIAAAAAAACDKQRFTSSPSPHMQQHSAAAVPNAQDSSSSSSPINAAQLAVVVSEQDVLLALLHHSTTALKHVLNHTAAVPNALAAAQNTVVQRVAAAAAAATQYVNFDAATDWQQLQGTMQHSFSLALTPGVLHVLSLSRNAGRQTGGAACVPHLLHAFTDLPAAAKLFQVALGAAVITADLKEQMEQDMNQYAVHTTGSGGSSSSNLGCVCGSGPDITCVCEHDGSKPWINGSELHGSSSRQQSSSVCIISQTDANSGSSSSGRRGSSSASPLLSRLGWIDTTLDSILTAAEQKDPTTAVATLTDTISRLAQQQQQHRPEQQWLAAAWSIIKQRLTTYLSLNCYIHQNNSVTDRFSLHNSVTHVSDDDNVTDDIRDSIEDSIIAAAHAEAVSLLTGVAAAAAVSLRIWDHQTSDIQVTLDLVMSHLDQINGSDSWQMNGCNICDLYLPIMVQMLPLTAPGSPWQQQQWQQQQQHQWQQQQQQQHDSAAVCNAAADRAKQHSEVYNNFIRCINRLQPHVISVMLHNSCSPQAVADALLLMLQQEQTNPSAAADRVDSSSSSSSSIAGGLQPTVCVAFMHSLTSALKNSGNGNSSSSSSSTTTSTGSWRGKHCRTSSSSSKQQQQQCLQPETLVHLLAACQSAPQQFTAQPDVTNAATELTAAAWLHMAAAADRYTSEQLVHVLKSVRKNKYFLRYTAVAGAVDHNNDASKALITGTKHILHRLCTKQTLKPEEAAAALAVLDTPLWPASMSQAAQSPLIQGLLNRVTDSIQDMSATQLEQLLSVAIRLPWCGLGRRLSEEWMFRVLEALVRVTTDVANKELDAATASTLAAALGDLCDLPVAASEQQMFELQGALPLLLRKLDERHTSMVLAFVSRQAQMNTNAAVVFL